MKGRTNQQILQPKLQRQLRNSATDAERMLWQLLKGRQLEGCKFRRQHPYGDYVLDFVCLERVLVVELDGAQDGAQHAEAQDDDARRTSALEAAGFAVMRFWNNDVFGNIEGVLEVIHRHLVPAPMQTPSPPNPPREGES